MGKVDEGGVGRYKGEIERKRFQGGRFFLYIRGIAQLEYRGPRRERKWQRKKRRARERDGQTGRQREREAGCLCFRFFFKL